MRQLFAIAIVCSLCLGCGQRKPGEPVSAKPAAAPAPPPKPAEPAGPKPLPDQVLRLNDPPVSAPHGRPLTFHGWQVKSGDAVLLNSDGFIEAVKPGQAMLELTVDNRQRFSQKIIVPEPEPLDFAQDIMPILTRQGCNSGGCHGRLDGQNGFKLSLFGYAPEADYAAIVKDSGGRRINLMEPQASLFLQKAAGQVAHGGGQAVAPSSMAYRQLQNWIASGVREHGPKPRKIKTFRVSPAEVRPGASGLFALHALAEYDDGLVRDVSAWADWKSLEPRVATVEPGGLMSIHETGYADIVARFGSLVTSVRVMLPGAVLPGQDYGALVSNSFIDSIVLDPLTTLNIAPSELTDDAAYLRRVTLDLVGRLPDPTEVRRFLKDESPDKRAKVVADLFKDADFTRFWSLKFGDLLQISTARQGPAAPFYLLWLQDQISRQQPWDAMVRTLLTTRGDPATQKEAAAAYSLENGDPVLASQLTAARLMGVRLRCAQCHDHPFDVWTQTQAHEFAAFFANVRANVPMPGQMMARPRIGYFAEGQVLHPRTQAKMEPKVLAGTQPELKPGTDPLPALAGWMTSPENPFFAKAFVNWLWAQFFATGLVTPVDDLSAANPPSNAKLLDALAKRFVEQKYQVQPMIQEIIASHAYQLSSQSNQGNRYSARLLAFQAPRPLTAQQQADALAQATGVPNRYANKPTGTRAIELQDPTNASNLLDTLGRCNRVEACGTLPGGSPASLRQSLLWISSDTVDGKVGALSGYVRQLLDLEPEPVEIAENLYLRTLSRFPTDDEKEHWKKAIESAPNRAEVVEDLFWALLNSREFLFNH